LALDLDDVLDLVPALAKPRECSELPGGLTNVNTRVATRSGVYVVRRWSDDTGLLAIDRANEYTNSVIAAEAGVGAPVVAFLPEHNTLVLEFVEGRTLSASDLDDPAMLERAAASCRRLHGAQRFRDDFDMFEIQQRYLAIVRERGFRLPERYLDFEPRVKLVRDALRVRAEATAPCNNDLLPENMLDGTRLWLIDYEYSGNNDPCFELGNLWSEAALPANRLETLVGAYYGTPYRNRIARARLWGLMSKYGWTLWASIQDGISTIDFDFWSWGLERYERAAAEFDGPEFEQLLDDVVRPD
jgi:thiamine kinase-like enzyme